MTKNNNLYRGTLDFRQQHLPPTIYLLSDVTIFKFPGFANFFFNLANSDSKSHI